MSKLVTLNGTCVLQLLKNDDGKFSTAIILQKDKDGLTPVFDFSINLLQENENMGLEFEFNADNIFINSDNTI
jgi:hypothetical protein